MRVWFVSRNYRLLIIGLPAIIIGVIVAGVALSMNRTVQTNQYAQNYERALFDAMKTDDVRGQEIALNSLLQLQPNSNRHRYNLALLRLRQDRVANGLATMRSLANEQNYPRARLWLTKRLLSSPDQRRVEEAIGHLQKVVKSEPDNAAASGMLGEVYLKLRQPSLAEPFLQQAAGFSPGAKLKYAECLLQLGRRETAEIFARQAEGEFRNLVGDNVGANDPQSELRVLWAESLRLQGRLQEAKSVLFQGLAVTDDDRVLQQAFGKLIAISATGERLRGASNVARFAEQLTQALRYDPENISVVTQLATLPLKPGQVNEETLTTINELLAKRIEEDPEQIEYQILLAWVQRMEGNSPQAIETMRSVVTEQPNLRLWLAQLYRQTGDSALATGEAEKTLQYFRGLIKAKPKEHANYIQMAQTYEFLGDWDRAIETLDRANETHPHSQLAAGSIKFRLARFDNLYKDKEDRPKQLKLVDSVLKLAPDNPQAVRRLGALVHGSSSEDEISQQARKRLIDQVSVGKNQFQIYSMLGTIADEKENFEDARYYLNRAAELQPNDPVVCNNLAHVLANGDNVEDADLNRALELANRALKTMPGHPEVLETRGEIYVKLKRFRDAQADLEACLGKSGDVRDVHRYLASAFAGLNQPELAARHKELSEQPDK